MVHGCMQQFTQTAIQHESASLPCQLELWEQSIHDDTSRLTNVTARAALVLHTVLAYPESQGSTSQEARRPAGGGQRPKAAVG